MNRLHLILGIILLSSPFISLTIWMIRESGWLIAFVVWGTVSLLTAMILSGICLITKSFGG
jgi:Mg/Co/Ni transporter MgtE